MNDETSNISTDNREQSVNSLYESYAQQLFNYGTKFCDDPPLIQDSIHDLFVALLSNRGDIIMRNTRAYLFKSFSRIVLANIKKKRNLEYKSEQIQRPDIYNFELSIESKLIDSEEQAELSQKLNDAINALSPRQKEIIFLRYYHNLSNSEISEIMGIDVNSVYKLSHASVLRLKHYI